MHLALASRGARRLGPHPEERKPLRRTAFGLGARVSGFGFRRKTEEVDLQDIQA